MDYTSERKNKADDQMIKATRRFKANKAFDKGDYGDVPGEYAKAAPGPTYDHEMRSGVVIEDEEETEMTENKTENLLRNVLAEAASFTEQSRGSIRTRLNRMQDSSRFREAHAVPADSKCICGSEKTFPDKKTCIVCGRQGDQRTKGQKQVGEAKELKSTDQKLNCAVCGDKHPTKAHPQSIHTAKALSPENNAIKEAKINEKRTGIKHEPINQKGSLWKQIKKKLQMEDEVDSEAKKDEDKIDSKEIQKRNKLEKCEACGKMHAADVPCPDKKLLADDDLKESYGDYYDHIADAHISHPLIRKDTDGKHYQYMGSTPKDGPEYRHHDGKQLHIKHGNFGTGIHPQDSDEQEHYENKVGTQHKGFWKGRGMTEAKSHNKFKKWNSDQMTIKTTPEDIKRRSKAVVGMPPPKKIIKSKLDKKPKYKERFDESELKESNAEVEQHAMLNAQHHGVLAKHGYEHQGTDPEHYSTYRHKDTSSVHLSPNGDWKHRGKNKSLVPNQGNGAKSLEQHLNKVVSRKKSAGNAKARHDAMTSLGLKRVKGAVSGKTYYESVLDEAKAFPDTD